MSLRRRHTAVVALVVAAGLSLAACGSSSDSAGSGTGNGAAAKGKDKQSVAKGGKDFGSAADKTAAMGTDAAPGRFPRTVTHAMGTTVIKTRPTRVVVLDVGELDNVVSLGVKPVGYAPSEGSPELPSYLKKDGGQPKSVGTINSLNLEAIAGLHPDLILGSQLRAAPQYAALSKIAPTVFSIRPGFTWKQNYLLNAAALDKTAEAKAKLADYDTRIKALDAKLDGRFGAHKPVVSMVRYMQDGKTRLYGNASFIGTILKDAGIPRPKIQDIDDLAVEISAENIDKADGDYIFTGVYGDPGTTDKARAQSNPLWKNLRAVKAGHAFDVPDETWYLGLGVTAADQVVADLTHYLAG
ncbi:ABC transporter substrate-binding protein [Actinacidiphila bryophytorum]|uniref:Iron complex transport system substrate-binding protein n=1 Tax=Actinacidiphila bryophytorum TaxID=1436133 RepID=A0A9W4E4D8_9ACTN|nr:iron-siderophore ABC transporter substrate-binding protein [Actinacidiphila bryophytorum]MBM9434769.1 iron-siderophore ABC transporter substrate-binding protein [Actinacidiphila bryophytorum]MBN6547065.1 iron-siderophore ABC transporter substrate-binding protein [Actinacidiphila bryophytorum]CAG7629936.1 Iron complex transport system substrate-binding protein [Actinacidiphila bryophytorum]